MPHSARYSDLARPVAPQFPIALAGLLALSGCSPGSAPPPVRAALEAPPLPSLGAEFAIDSAVPRSSGIPGGPTAVASDGADFLVVWADEREGTGRVWGARVRKDGVPLDVDGAADPWGSTNIAIAMPAIRFAGTARVLP